MECDHPITVANSEAGKQKALDQKTTAALKPVECLIKVSITRSIS